jgi:3',5'-cyclic AMP phosphodiesterase CpdA
MAAVFTVTPVIAAWATPSGPQTTAPSTPSPTTTPAITVNSVDLGIGANQTQRLVTWYGTSGRPGEVELAPACAQKGSDFPWRHMSFPAVTDSSNATVTGFDTFRATVMDLWPHTEYVYRVGNGDAWSPIYHFRTHGFCAGHFSFMFAGDPQIGAGLGYNGASLADDTNGWTTTLGHAVRWFPHASFLLSLGDQVDANNNEAQYAGFFAPPELPSMTLATVIGNHDSGIAGYTAGAANYTAHFTVPNPGNNSADPDPAGGDYWFSYNNVLFMILNSNNTNDASHMDFMEGAIAAYKAQHHGHNPLWKIVAFHHSIFSVANHTNDPDIILRRADLPPMFKALGIDAVLGGHDHSYARTLVMDGETPIYTGYKRNGSNQYASYTEAPGASDTVYICANSSSGSKFYPIQTQLTFPWLAVDNQEKVPNIGTVRVTPDSLTFTVYRSGASNTADNAEDVVDTFTLNRATPSCASTR